MDIVTLDASGSMIYDDYEPTRWLASIEALENYLDLKKHRCPDDYVGVVGFASNPAVMVPPVPAQQITSSDLALLKGHNPDGKTNHEAGLELASRLLKLGRKLGQTRVIMLTDGWTTTGSSPLETAQALKDRGTIIEVIGVGGKPTDVNEAQLKQIASTINNQVHYYFIKSVPDLVEKFQALTLLDCE